MFLRNHQQLYIQVYVHRASLVAQMVKDPPANGEDSGLIPGPRRSPGEGNGSPLQYPCLGHPMDTGAWWAIIHGVAKELNMS